MTVTKDMFGKDIWAGRWWTEKKEVVHQNVVATFQQIDARQIGTLTRSSYFLSLYEGKAVTNLDGYLIENTNPHLYDEESRENVIRPAVDSLVAKISTNNPRLVTQTNGGDWELQQKAKDRTLLAEGVINDQKGYEIGRQVFKDGCIWDIGAMKVYPDYTGQRVIYERLIPHEVIVDPFDGRYGNPQSLYTIRIVHKDVLRGLYPRKHWAIDNAGWIRDYVKHASPTDELCGVIECWHLPSKPGATDGRHIICTSHGTLYDGPWTRDTFPVVVWRWKTRQYGWRGFSAVEDIENYQKQIDFLDEKIGKLMNNLGYRIGIPKGSNVNIDELTNDVDSIPCFTYTGQQPPFYAPDPDPPASLFAERERKKQAAFEQLGISLLLAQSKKPSGLDSGVAIREYKDTESERFKDVGLAWEDWWIRVGEQTMYALEDLSMKVPGCKIQIPVDGELHEMVLSKTDWAKNKYKIAIRPSGLLPREPAGRLQTIQEMSQIWPDMAQVLASTMQAPDVDDAMALVAAPVNAVRQDIDQMMGGEPAQPEPFLNIGLAKMLVLQNYQKIKSQKAPEQIQQYHRDYLVMCDDMLKQIQAEQAMLAAKASPLPAPSAPGMPPPGAPPLPGGA